MFPLDSPVRHGWAWLSENGSGARLESISPAHLRLIDEWRKSGRPFVVASPGQSSLIRLGLATPDKQRIGFEVNRSEIARFAPPLGLLDAIDSAPGAWSESLRCIAGEAARHGLSVYVYGSLAWTYRSNLMFLRPASDVDLIFVPRRSSIAPLHSFLGALASRGDAPRLDGELIIPAGAVSWRELAAQPETLLVKTALGPVIQSRAQFEEAMAASIQ